MVYLCPNVGDCHGVGYLYNVIFHVLMLEMVNVEYVYNGIYHTIH